MSNLLFTNTVNKQLGNVRLQEEMKKIRGGDTYVVDTARLSERHQMLVFGDVVRAVYELKLEGRDDQDEELEDVPEYVVIFVDELNKYAPNNAPKSSPLLRYLLEIAERGRSMGIVLFSAEQFRSAVEDRIKGNCSTQVYGRTNASEIARKDYTFIPNTYRNMMTRLRKGDLLIEHPVFRTLLKISFPMPAYRQK
jgi:DNA helicase HerA-like ATPase